MMSFSYRAKLSKKLNKCTYRPIWSEFCADPSMIRENKKVYKKMLNRFIEAFVYDLKLGWNVDDKIEK